MKIAVDISLYPLDADFIPEPGEVTFKEAEPASLDELLRRVLATQGPIDVTKLSEIAKDLIGEPSDALHIDKLLDCPRMTPADNSD